MPDDLFTARDNLAHIRAYAHARMVSPWAVLGNVLTRVIAAIPATVQLPPLTGGTASLNMCVAVVGASGIGKGAASQAADDAVTILDGNGNPVRTGRFPIGSGEGIARTFKNLANDDGAPVAAIFTAEEVDTLGALGKRQGATIMQELRKLYSGEALGFTNARAETTTLVDPHSYRAALVVGVQPRKAGTLLDDADGGTPQRFVWVPATDPDAPARPPACPEPLTLQLPTWGPDPETITIPDTARSAIQLQRHAALTGQAVNPLDGHALLCRLKVAAALQLLDGRRDMTPDDWTLAGAVMGMSAWTRDECEQEIRAARRARNRARGHDAADRDEAREERRFQRALDAVRRAIHNNDGAVAHRDVQSSTRVDIRDQLDAAINHLLDAREIEADGSGNGTVYRFADGTARTAVQHTKPQVTASPTTTLDATNSKNPQVDGAVRAVPAVPPMEGENTRDTSGQAAAHERKAEAKKKFLDTRIRPLLAELAAQDIPDHERPPVEGQLFLDANRHGVGVPTIARELGYPQETVRWRLRKALEAEQATA